MASHQTPYDPSDSCVTLGHSGFHLSAVRLLRWCSCQDQRAERWWLCFAFPVEIHCFSMKDIQWRNRTYITIKLGLIFKLDQVLLFTQMNLNFLQGYDLIITKRKQTQKKTHHLLILSNILWICKESLIKLCCRSLVFKLPRKKKKKKKLQRWNNVSNAACQV